MTSTALKLVPAEPVPEEDGLIHGLSAAELQILGSKCIDAKATAYCPYSQFRVGASLLLHPSASPTPTTEPYLITGANVENASYPVGMCAEKTAVGTAVVLGHRIGSFKAVGVATDTTDFSSPCGNCRQFLREFCEEHVPVFMFNVDGEYKVRTMGELLPMSFGPDHLPPRDLLKQLQEKEKAKKA